MKKEKSISQEYKNYTKYKLKNKRLIKKENIKKRMFIIRKND